MRHKGCSGTSVEVLNVFVSSPQDVDEERRAALEVLLELPRKPSLRRAIAIHPVLSDDPAAPTPLRADEPPQASVNRYKPTPSECDLTV
ncbi:MAG TPA: hypothetical protein VGK73_24025, partial [Polyangiaceae bacterium]